MTATPTSYYPAMTSMLVVALWRARPQFSHSFFEFLKLFALIQFIPIYISQS